MVRAASLLNGVFLLALLALAACGGGRPPDAATLYADAGERMAGLTSYSSTIEFQLPDGSSSAIDIDMVPPDKFQVDWGHNTNTIGIGDQFYIRQHSEEWEEACASARPARYCPEEAGMFGMYIAAFLPALATEMSDPTYLGTEVIGGVMTHHLQTTLPLQVLRLVEPQRTESQPVDLWIGAEDSLVHRYLFQFPEWTVTYTLSRFDEPIRIEAPADARPAG